METESARRFYDELGDGYDRMVSWEKRLGRELGFFRRLFAKHGVHSVLDAACGTGMHAIAFARDGLSASGADVSPAMLARARENAAAAGVEVPFVEAGFGLLARAMPGPFDAVTCLGNSLPHLLDDDSLARCLADFAALLPPGGLLVIQNRNYDMLLRKPERFLPLSTRQEEGGETLFLRITDFKGGENLEFTIVIMRKRDGVWSQSEQTTPLRAIRRSTLEKGLEAAGFASVTLYGSYERASFDAPGTSNLIAVAVHGGEPR